MKSYIIALSIAMVILTIITIGCFVEDYRAAKKGKKAILWERKKK